MRHQVVADKRGLIVPVCAFPAQTYYACLAEQPFRTRDIFRSRDIDIMGKAPRTF